MSNPVFNFEFQPIDTIWQPVSGEFGLSDMVSGLLAVFDSVEGDVVFLEDGR